MIYLILIGKNIFCERRCVVTGQEFLVAMTFVTPSQQLSALVMTTSSNGTFW